MTCIVGITHGKTVWLGGDSALTNVESMHQFILREPKVFVREHIAVGVCGSLKVLNVLAHSRAPLPPPGDDDRSRYVIRTLVPFIRDELQAAGTLTKNGHLHGELLIGCMGQLYVVHGNLQVASLDSDFNAIGSGAEVAIGSLATTARIRDPRRRIELALSAAAAANAGVRPPFRTVSITAKS